MQLTENELGTSNHTRKLTVIEEENGEEIDFYETKKSDEGVDFNTEIRIK